LANITIYEFFEAPDEQGELSWPEDVVTTVADSATHTLRQQTVYVVLTCDANCRMSFHGGSAVASGMNLLSTVPNLFKMSPGASRTLKFVAEV
jgi:hypothetical protein